MPKSQKHPGPTTGNVMPTRKQRTREKKSAACNRKKRWRSCGIEERLFRNVFGQEFRSILDNRKTKYPPAPRGPHVLRHYHRPSPTEKLARPSEAATVFGTVLYMEDRARCAADGYMWGRRKAVTLSGEGFARQRPLHRVESPPISRYSRPINRLFDSCATVEFGPIYRLDLEKTLRSLYDPNCVASTTGLYTLPNLLRRESIRWSKPMRYWLNRIWAAARTKRLVLEGDRDDSAENSSDQKSSRQMTSSASRRKLSANQKSDEESALSSTSNAFNAKGRSHDPELVQLQEVEAKYAAFGSGPRRQVLDQDEYMEMHHMMCLALGHCDKKGRVDPKMKLVALEDWKADASGHKLLDYHRFTQCWFQLADQHTEEIDEQKYVEFVKEMSAKMTIHDPQLGGCLRWRVFDEIIARDRRKQRERRRRQQILRLTREHAAKRIQTAWIHYCERLYYEDCARRGISCPGEFMLKMDPGIVVKSTSCGDAHIPKNREDTVVTSMYSDLQPSSLDLDGALLAQLIAPQVFDLESDGGYSGDGFAGIPPAGDLVDDEPPATPFEALFRDLHSGVGGVGVNQYGIASGFNAHGLQRSPVRDISTAPSKLESGEGRRASNSIQGFRNSTASPPVPPSPMRTSLNLLAPPPQAPPPPVFMDVSKSWCKEVAVDLIQTTWRHRRARHRIGNDENTKYSSWSKVDTIPTRVGTAPAKSGSNSAVVSPRVGAVEPQDTDHLYWCVNSSCSDGTDNSYKKEVKELAKPKPAAPSSVSIVARAATHYACASQSSARPSLPQPPEEEETKSGERFLNAKDTAQKYYTDTSTSQGKTEIDEVQGLEEFSKSTANCNEPEMIDLAKIEQGQSLQTAQNTSSNQSCARIFTGAAVELFNLDKRESVTVGATQTANAAQSDSFFQDSNETGHREGSNDHEGDALSVHGISRSMELAHARRHMAARRLQMWARAARLTRLCARCTAFGGIGVTVRRTSKDGGGKHHLHHHLSASARSSYSSSPSSLEKRDTLKARQSVETKRARQSCGSSAQSHRHQNQQPEDEEATPKNQDSKVQSQDASTSLSSIQMVRRIVPQQKNKRQPSGKSPTHDKNNKMLCCEMKEATLLGLSTHSPLVALKLGNIERTQTENLGIDLDLMVSSSSTHLNQQSNNIAIIKKNKQYLNSRANGVGGSGVLGKLTQRMRHRVNQCREVDYYEADTGIWEKNSIKSNFCGIPPADDMEIYNQSVGSGSLAALTEALGRITRAGVDPRPV